VRVAEFGVGQSEAALRRVGGYRCRRRGTYCTRRIDVGRGLARAASWSRSCAERWGRLALESAWPCLDADVTSQTRAELKVRPIYEPSRLAAVYVSAAYAQVVPARQRPTGWTLASALASMSRVVTVRPEMADGGARQAG
jgi:hypothetical protein